MCLPVQHAASGPMKTQISPYTQKDMFRMRMMSQGETDKNNHYSQFTQECGHSKRYSYIVTLQIKTTFWSIFN